MENKIKLSTALSPYVKHFQVAQLNLNKYLEEEAHVFNTHQKRKRPFLKKS